MKTEPASVVICAVITLDGEAHLRLMLEGERRAVDYRLTPDQLQSLAYSAVRDLHLNCKAIARRENKT